MKKIVIITGGTMVHVSPHFSLCAPAYGKVGADINMEFHLNDIDGKDYNVILTKTKMAGGNDIETNDDLFHYVDELIEDPNVGAIIFAAAVCDFEPELLSGYNSLDDESDEPIYETEEFGKSQPRLSSKNDYNLYLMQSEKIIDKIKKDREDIFLVTFKTTSNEDMASLIGKCQDNAFRCNSDICFGNDIKNHYNNLFINNDKATNICASRDECIKFLVEEVRKNLKGG